jgi:hypothetical protein
MPVRLIIFFTDKKQRPAGDVMEELLILVFAKVDQKSQKLCEGGGGGRGDLAVGEPYRELLGNLIL